MSFPEVTDGAICAQVDPDLLVEGDRLLDRIDKFVDISGECWRWLGQLNNKGYGLMSVRNQKRAAHVVVWESLVGAVPKGLELDHLCRVRACVNPDHLEPVTGAENQQRAAAAMTGCRKANHDWSNPENVYLVADGGRRCLECARIRDRARGPRHRSTTRELVS